MEWWVPWALALAAIGFVGGLLVLVVLAVRGVWRLFHPGGAHVAGPVAERWVPWETDPRFGSMILAEERATANFPAVSSKIAANAYPAPPLDWREVAHEGDWRDQTAAALAPATLDTLGGDAVDSRRAQAGPVEEGTVLSSGPGGLAWPGPDPERLCGPEQPHEKPAGTESAGSGHLDEPEPERTWAGRPVETSDQWLQRLMAAASPGWTYAGELVAA